jgi:hypothetical protein
MKEPFFGPGAPSFFYSAIGAAIVAIAFTYAGLW